MSRKEILSSPEYWMAKAQIDLYNRAEDFMAAKDMNRTQLAEYLGVSKGYVSQLLNGDYDHKLSKFFELAVAFGYIPKIEFQSIEDALAEDRYAYGIPDVKSNVRYIPGNVSVGVSSKMRSNYESVPQNLKIDVA